MRRQVFVAVLIVLLVVVFGPVVSAQAEFVTATGMPTHAPDQMLWSLVAAYVIQYLKKSSWFRLVSETSAARAKAQVGFLAALLTTAGVHFAFTGSVLDGEGGTLTVTGLSVNVFRDVIFAWVTQQGWYDMIVRRSA